MMLADSRPYEGFVFSLPIGYAMFFWIFGRPGAFLGRFQHVIVPLTAIVLLATLATGYHCWRVTGNPIRMPQQVDCQTYVVAPYFIWQHPRPQSVNDHGEMRDFYLHNELVFYQQTRSVETMVALWIVNFTHIWVFLLGPVPTIPLLVAIAISSHGMT